MRAFDSPMAVGSQIERVVTAFRQFFGAPDAIKEACSPWNTEELPREFGFINGMETKEQWFGTRHHCVKPLAAQGPTGWPDDGSIEGVSSFREAVLEAMALYDRTCRRVLSLVAPELLDECAAVPAEYAHSGILDAFAYFNAVTPEEAAASSPPVEGEVQEDAYKNCGEHYDPGYFTIAPCAVVHGLQLLDRASGQWIYNEDHAVEGKELTIFCNEWLETVTVGRFKAMRHRVATQPNTPRLSMLYELRLHRERWMDTLKHNLQQQQPQQQPEEEGEEGEPESAAQTDTVQ
jgi:isopenicillin N synthase-like dioxygenase